MGREASQFDISNYQLQAASIQPGLCTWTEIGEPKITYTISGKARVCQVSEKGSNYRSWLLALLVVAVIASIAWLEWIGPQLNERLLNAAPPPPPSAKVRISPPAYQPEYTPPSASTLMEASKQIAPMQADISNPAANRMSTPQPSPALKPAVQLSANPEADQSLKTGNMQSVAPATINSPSKNQTNQHQLPRLSAPIKPVAPVVAAHPATQPEPATSVAVPARADPLSSDASPAPVPAGNNQPPVPVSIQQ